jgi:SAM-dependent methyltransferase
VTDSLPPEYFEDLYVKDADPWRFATSDYEREKYDATLQALPANIGHAFEIGCSIGVLTERLTARAKTLLAVDVSPTALAQARARCADISNVTIAQMRIPQDWPEGAFDTILFSEVLYYLSADDLAATARLTLSVLKPGGTVLLVHYTRPTNYPASGDQASENFIAQTRLSIIRQLRTADYRLDLLQR